jgi:hypothetical protein
MLVLLRLLLATVLHTCCLLTTMMIATTTPRSDDCRSLIPVRSAGPFFSLVPLAETCENENTGEDGTRPAQGWAAAGIADRGLKG